MHVPAADREHAIRADRRRKAKRAVVTAALFTLFATSAIVQQAVAGHYHEYNLIVHGLVHGESDTDGSFFGRTYGYHIGAINVCAVGQYGDGDTATRTYSSSASADADLCSVWSRSGNSYQNECRGWAYARVYRPGASSDILQAHYHSAHSPPVGSCPVRQT